MTDCWGGYNFMSKRGIQHSTVNHDKVYNYVSVIGLYVSIIGICQLRGWDTHQQDRERVATAQTQGNHNIYSHCATSI